MIYQSEYKTVTLVHNSFNHKIDIFATNEVKRYCDWFISYIPIKSFDYGDRNDAIKFISGIAPIYQNPDNQFILQFSEYWY